MYVSSSAGEGVQEKPASEVSAIVYSDFLATPTIELYDASMVFKFPNGGIRLFVGERKDIELLWGVIDLIPIQAWNKLKEANNWLPVQKQNREAN
jgi:hypothetical protein